jgi:GT2 family glycosyltransferase
MKKKIVVSILNFNSGQETIECLKSLQKIDQSQFEMSVTVRDNGSSQPFQVNTADFKDIHLSVDMGKENLGFSGGHNEIIRKSQKNGFDYILILNNDVILDKNFLKYLFEESESDSKIGITVPKIYFAKGYEFHKSRYEQKELGKVIWYAGGEMDWNNIIGFHRGVDQVDVGQFEETCETPFPTGACMLVSREVIEKTGMFDDRYFLYYEDSDWTMRIKKAGYTIMYLPKSIIWHKNAASSGSGSPLHDYYITRNRLLFGLQYSSLRTQIALIKESLKLLTSGRKWQKVGVKDYYIKKLGKGSYK